MMSWFKFNNIYKLLIFQIIIYLINLSFGNDYEFLSYIVYIFKSLSYYFKYVIVNSNITF